MQPVLKEKSRGLRTFARGKSDSNAQYNAPSEQPHQADLDRRSATPNAATYQPSRQEIAEFARLPVPGVGLKIASSPRLRAPLRSIHRMESPVHEVHSSPKHQTLANRNQSNAAHHDIFSGSQLGENFMKSGLTTPVNDSEVLAVVQPPETKTEERAERNQAQGMAHLAPRYIPSSHVDKHHFSLDPDGRLSVVPGFHRHNPSHMNDGFYNSNTNNDYIRYQPKPVKQLRPSSNPPAPLLQQAQARLPMRGVRLNRGQTPLPNVPAIQEQTRPQSKFAELEQGKSGELTLEMANESILVHDSDDDFDAFGGYGGGLTSSKLKKQNAGHTKSALDGLGKPNGINRKLQHKDKKRRRPSLDYDDRILSSMTFRDLQEEPFDVVSQLPGIINGHDSATSKLTTRLGQFQHQEDREQYNLFKNMSIEEWEDAGDWFVDQFAEIMKRLRQARRNKRTMVAEFEAEASEREEAIRLRTEAIDKKLTRMKQDGQRVVGDKDL